MTVQNVEAAERLEGTRTYFDTIDSQPLSARYAAQLSVCDRICLPIDGLSVCLSVCSPSQSAAEAVSVDRSLSLCGGGGAVHRATGGGRGRSTDPPEGPGATRPQDGGWWFRSVDRMHRTTARPGRGGA